MESFLNFLESLLDYIYKKKCYFCGNSDESVRMCSKCYDDLQISAVKVNRLINGSEVYVSGIYESYLQKMIRGLKYHKQKELAYYQAKFMWEYFSDVIITQGLKKRFQVVPVPLYKTRERKRGYNHMQLVAKEFCILSGFEPCFNLIKRVKMTRPQYKLSRNERSENLKNAFKVDKSYYNSDLPILIIDDICTTGSTFESMIYELKLNGIEDITCLATSSPY